MTFGDLKVLAATKESLKKSMFFIPTMTSSWLPAR